MLSTVVLMSNKIEREQLHIRGALVLLMVYRWCRDILIATTRVLTQYVTWRQLSCGEHLWTLC
jgi:hypothetical protein